jgi:hypothetical protein
VLDVFLAGTDRLLQQSNRAHDLAAGAIAALVAVMLHKRRLHGMQIIGLSNPFNGGDFIALVHHREREAAVHAAAVHMHRARAALAVITALFCAGKMNPLAQRVEQSGACVEAAQRVVLTIDAERNTRGSCGVAPMPERNDRRLKRPPLAAESGAGNGSSSTVCWSGASSF